MSRSKEEEINSTDVIFCEQKLEDTKQRLERCKNSISEYNQTVKTLSTFSDVPRRHVMASVCNGLAYFDAVVENTNNFLALLGDGYFAEKSSKQAKEVAQRRLDFLRKEEKFLQGQVNQAEQTLKFAQQQSTEMSMSMMGGGGKGNYSSKKKETTNTEQLIGDSGSNTSAAAASAMNAQQEFENYYGGDDYGDDDSDTDSFDSCDKLNLREIEELEEDMLRETDGEGWSDEIFTLKLRDRQETKREKRLNEESKVQSELKFSSLDEKNSGGDYHRNKEQQQQQQQNNIPLHPGQVGIIEQLQQMQEAVQTVSNAAALNEKNNSNNVEQTTKNRVSFVDPTEMKKDEGYSTETTTTTVNNKKEEEKEQEQEPTLGAVVERTPSSSSSASKLAPMNNSGSSSSSKKTSLFKQRRSG